MNRVKKVEDSQLWKWASDITLHVHSLLVSLPEEEKWTIGNKLRQRVFDATSDIAEAVGSVDPRDIKWHLGMARSSLFSVKSTLYLSEKMGLITSTPELMVMIDKSVDEVDKQLEIASGDIPKWLQEMQVPPKRTDK